MPNYELPPLPKNEEEEKPKVVTDSSEEDVFPDSFDRTIRVPVNQAILDALRTGDTAEVMLTGEVSETTDHQMAEGKNRRFIEVQVQHVSAYRQGDRIEEEAMESAYRGEETGMEG